VLWLHTVKSRPIEMFDDWEVQAAPTHSHD